jgi:RNA polymerase sigma-70 factor (ECF subfamily)
MSDTLAWDEVDRSRLVRLCALVSGSWAAAEDLAQETLLEAYRNAHKVTDLRGRDRWVGAIARNVCRRWARSEATARTRTCDLPDSVDLADTFDVELELERDELANLVDRALALLPEQTRDVLVRRYVEETSPAAIAESTGLSADAVSMRISRGKLLLRRLLEGKLREDAEAFGFVIPDVGSWRRTSVWCPQCGRNRLEMSAIPSRSIALRCTGCSPAPGALMSCYSMSNPSLASALGAVSRPTAIVSRASAWVYDYFVAGLPARTVPCMRCRRPTPLRQYVRDEGDLPLETRHGVYFHCESCGEEGNCSVGGLVLSLPEVRTFRRSHPRIRSTPARLVEHQGREVFVLGYADVISGAGVDVLLDRLTLDVRSVRA